mgnify:CR=1 FL=1
MEYSNFDKLIYLLVSYGCGDSYATHASKYIIDFAKRNNIDVNFAVILATSLNKALGKEPRNILTYITKLDKHFERSLLTPRMLFNGLCYHDPRCGWFDFNSMMYILKDLANKGVLK